MKFIYTCFLMMLCSLQSFGQAPSSSTFIAQKEIRKTAAEDSLIEKRSKQYQRKHWYVERRRGAEGEPVNIAKGNRKALQEYRKMHPEHQRNPHGSWSFLGPNATATGGKQGRVNSIDIHPTNDQIIYVCTANGGVWKSTIGGFTWHALTDHLGILAFADLEIDQTNPDVIYALSGDGNPAPNPNRFHSQAEVWSAGIFKSTDAGNTWQKTNYEFPENITPNKLLMHPTNSNIQYVACNEGIYKTTDGWNTNATKVDTKVTYDLELHPTNPTKMYASGVNDIRTSVDAGETWPQAMDVDFAIMATASRVELAVTPDFPSYVAAIAGNWDFGSQGIFYSLLEGQDNTWVPRDNVTNIVLRQATYNMTLCIDPDNYNRWYGGGFQLWRTTNEGQVGSWTNIGDGNIHEDQHDVVYKNGKLFVANDGGIFRSTDQGETWIDLSEGLQNTEIYRLAGTEDNSNLFLIGTQDNGAQRRQSGTTFDKVIHGDGMECRIANDNQNIMYGTRENADFIYISTDAGDNFSTVPIPGGPGGWITPIVLDPSDSDILFMGKDSVYRTVDGGSTWQLIGNPPAGKLNNLAQGTSNRNRMYASRNAVISRSDNVLANASSVTWTQIGGGLPAGFITDIAVDPNDSRHVFITKGSYTDGTKVFESTDAGDDDTWTNISGSLPNVPVLSIAYHNDASGLDRLYIGTDIGVFYRDDNLGDWIYFSNSLPAVPVEDIYINSDNNTISIATYGRGLWRSELLGNCQSNKYFSSGVTHIGRFHFTYLNTVQSLATLSTQPNTNITYTAGNIITLSPGFTAPKNSVFKAQIGGCPY